MMADNDLAAENPDKISPDRPVAPRKPRSIRFSDSEWSGIEREAKARGMTAAELARHAAVSVAGGRIATGSPAFPPELAAQIERIYRGVYLLSTLKRDEMFLEGRREDYERIRNSAQDSQVAIFNEASKVSV